MQAGPGYRTEGSHPSMAEDQLDQEDAAGASCWMGSRFSQAGPWTLPGAAWCLRWTAGAGPGGPQVRVKSSIPWPSATCLQPAHFFMSTSRPGPRRGRRSCGVSWQLKGRQRRQSAGARVCTGDQSRPHYKAQGPGRDDRRWKAGVGCPAGDGRPWREGGPSGPEAIAAAMPAGRRGRYDEQIRRGTDRRRGRRRTHGGIRAPSGSARCGQRRD